MTVMVAVPDSPEGRTALSAAIDEARRRATDLVVLNLALGPLDLVGMPTDLTITVKERTGYADLADCVLAALDEHADAVDVLVIGMKRRSPIGKALLGSLSQRLLLEAEVPVLAVKR
ncbi:universal stress protein [Pseudonocardia sp. WMMC193]|uniref:universal stress protein n=1 Tax=Pseudonocardia sp. WMMC193 TaxID=2911965 RepID=UPI001F16447C|nr:universal stress protein [Pseudonocardia sp. WMMC193]MCF7549866.1 universal stress protein [Pseudonocardia sp. WMMC193]